MTGYSTIPMYSRLLLRSDILVPEPSLPSFHPVWRCRKFSLQLQCNGNRTHYIALFSPHQTQSDSEPPTSFPVKYMFGDAEAFDQLRAKDFVERYLMDPSLEGTEVVVFLGIPCAIGGTDTMSILQEVQRELRCVTSMQEDIAETRKRPNTISKRKVPLSALDMAFYYPRVHLVRGEIPTVSDEQRHEQRGSPNSNVAGTTQMLADGDPDSDTDSAGSNSTAQQHSSPPTSPEKEADLDLSEDELRQIEDSETIRPDKPRRGRNGRRLARAAQEPFVWPSTRQIVMGASTVIAVIGVCYIVAKRWRK
ncbi:hypothetical protein CALCODRAFT_520973 [Calocera cornea HHB12733]|uniref:Uncharacterized protein n=1 Tax=Calocera cornea HHB12733 TaxID=1353952 RepID=A0A165D4K2_9BASI|nr:hypothetical protein CALCODRAFT_520973 [Calocera cornea HHB12733]